MITFELRGFDGLKNRLNRLEKAIPTAKRQILSEAGRQGKMFALQRLQMAGKASGQLVASMHYQTTENYVRIFNNSPIATYWEFGVKPHWVYRSQISPEGYSVSDWMNMKLDTVPGRFWMDNPKLVNGIHFMEYSYDRLNEEIPRILARVEKQILT